jgi:hypothetical protein
VVRVRFAAGADMRLDVEDADLAGENPVCENQVFEQFLFRNGRRLPRCLLRPFRCPQPEVETNSSPAASLRQSPSPNAKSRSLAPYLTFQQDEKHTKARQVYRSRCWRRAEWVEDPERRP